MMKVYRDLATLPVFKNAVVTIGSFDGVHTGHQKILARIRQLAKELSGESIVLTFHPHPRLVLNPDDDSLRLLSTADEKIKLVQNCGIDHLVFVPFTKAFAAQSPDRYIRNFLVQRFRPSRIVIGYDHHFGKNRQGNIDYLKRFEFEFGYIVEEISKQEIDDVAVSSTKIRRAISKGNVHNAAQLLGHVYSLEGEVIYGQQIGKQLGFPTANLKISQPYKLIPSHGIYAVLIEHDQQKYEGMLYIGQRPTLEGIDELMIEVNIFDFDKNIYEETLRIFLIKKIREDKKFDGLEALKAQLILDKAMSLAALDVYKKEQQQIAAIPPSPTVAVVILNYNTQDLLETFLPKVLATTYNNLKVIVADNGSTDESVAYMQTVFPKVRLIQLEENYGFAKGYNEALKQISADYFILLNTDVEVEKDWVKPIIELMEKDRTIGACQPKILCYDDKSVFEYAGAAGGWLDKWGYPFCRGRIFDTLEKDEKQYDTVQEVFWATGAAMFIKANLFKGLGGFDESYFAHQEEIDLCWRLKRAGYKVMVHPKSVVYHIGGGTLPQGNPRKTYLNFRNSLTTLFKNEDPTKLRWLIPLRLILDGVAGVKFFIQGKFQDAKAIVKAHFDFYRRFMDIKKQRAIDKENIEKLSIRQKTNNSGIYPKSIVWQYYIRRKKYFKNL